MNTYEVRSQEGEGLVGIATDGDAKAVLDRHTGTLTVGETDSLGRFKAQGLRGSIGYDPLAPVPVLVVLDGEGREVHRAEVPEQGDAPEGETLGVDDAAE